MMNLHRRHQADTVRTRPVSSTVNPGCEVIAAADVKMTAQDFRHALRTLSEDCYAVGWVAWILWGSVRGCRGLFARKQLMKL